MDSRQSKDHNYCVYNYPAVGSKGLNRLLDIEISVDFRICCKFQSTLSVQLLYHAGVAEAGKE